MNRRARAPRREQTLKPAAPQSGGKPLEPAVQAQMGARFGQDFSTVRVHADAAAARSAKELGAQAYTLGKDVVFGEGRYAPERPEGQQLLAHELAHTVQQRGGGAPGCGAEAEADRAADAALSGRRVPQLSAMGAGLQMKPLAPPASPAGSEQSEAPVAAPSAGRLVLDRFATGSAVLSAEHKAQIKAAAPGLLSSLNAQPGSMVQAVGHTDTVGTEANNLVLGQRRAEAVKAELVKNGLPAARIVTTSEGEGGTQAVKTKDETPNASNRRVEVETSAAPAPAQPAAPHFDPLPEQPKPAPRPFDPFQQPAPLPGPRRQEAPPAPVVPPVPQGAGPKPLGPRLAHALDPVVNAITRGFGLSPALQAKARELAQDAVFKGTAAGLNAALQAAGITNDRARGAIVDSVIAELKGGKL